MGSNTAGRANEIASAQLAESTRQYEEQKAEKEAKKKRDKENAQTLKEGGVAAYNNMASTKDNLTYGIDQTYSLLNTGNSTSTIGGNSDKLG